MLRSTWNTWNSLLLMLAVLFVVALPLGGSSYLCGRFSYNILFDACFIFPGLVLLHLAEAIVYVVCLIVKWRKYSSGKRIVVTVQTAIISYFLLSLFTLSGLWLPGYKPFTYGFRERVRNLCDITAIQEWLKTVDKQLCTNETTDILSNTEPRKAEWPDSIDWPDVIKVFNPHYVNLALDESGNAKLRLMWGGTLALWGFEIGPEDMEIPKTKERKREEISYNGKKQVLWHRGEYRLPLAPGAYVWYVIQ